jgi:hypothetical protein
MASGIEQAIEEGWNLVPLRVELGKGEELYEKVQGIMLGGSMMITQEGSEFPVVYLLSEESQRIFEIPVGVGWRKAIALVREGDMVTLNFEDYENLGGGKKMKKVAVRVRGMTKEEMMKRLKRPVEVFLPLPLTAKEQVEGEEGIPF